MRKFVVLIKFQVFAATGVLALCAISPTPVLAQDGEAEATIETTLVEDVESAESAAPSYTAVSATNPEISTTQLDLLINPLTADELTAEADAWRLVLQERVQSISQLELAIEQENDILAARQDIVGQLNQAQEAGAPQAELDAIQRQLTEFDAQATAAQSDPQFRQIFAEARRNYAITTGADLVTQARNQLADIESDIDKTKATELIADLERALSSYESAESKLDAPFFSDSRYEKANQLVEGRKSRVTGAYRSLENSNLFTPKLGNDNAQEQIRDQLIAQSTVLDVSRSELITRMQLVLDELENKGGDIEPYERYIAAVSGLELDVTDAQGLKIRFLTWLQSEEGGIKFGLGLLKFGGILTAAFIIAPRAGKLANNLLGRVDTISTLFREFTVAAVKRAVFVVGGLLALASLGVNLGPIIAFVGGASFVFAFALQSNLGNFASGLMLLLYKPFDVDDEIEVAGEWAVVREITLANTILQAWNNGRIISIPNSTVWGSTIVNRTPKDGVRKLSEVLMVNVNQDLVKVKRVVDEVIKAHPLVLKDYWSGTFAYQVKEHAVICYVARAKADDYWTLHEELVLQVYSRLREEGIVFSTPEHHVSLDSPRNNGNGGAYELVGQKTVKLDQNEMGADFDPA